MVDVADPDDVEPEAVHHRPRSAGLIVTVAIMTALLIAAAAFVAYLWRVSEAWELRVAELTQIGYDLGEQLAGSAPRSPRRISRSISSTTSSRPPRTPS
ncbi:hypothetical protein GCM10025873_11100 [Demequina sediminis]|nr:hypothetical protein GCM10025873_11100 [Demequina sediminis]